MKKILFLLFAFLPCMLFAEVLDRDLSEDEPATKVEKKSKSKKEKSKKILTGFSGGMMLHGGYSFSKNPQELFRNATLSDLVAQGKNLPKDGATVGLGGALRLHLIDHIHLGAEGHVSTMPLMKSGSSIRSGWGGALIDFYAKLGPVTPLIGGMIGGGASNRLYVPENAETVSSGETQTTYNATYVKIPFFCIDPYVGLEFSVFKRSSLILRVDYMLPFGKSDKGIQAADLKWGNFLTPSGPRLYIGFLFGH